ncbi:unnamed protein product [Owenia fusiformis]|uniref:PEHE domain-containing protein n=1 Tax=Owenia fusiformis TaxID=6347 RepID=A0A8S4P427_OWEFU|nr:unnamed protein product [Owenia fusiformis]
MATVLMPSSLRYGTRNIWENQLKCRLERMERRMSLLKQQNGRSGSRDRYSRKFIPDEADIKPVISPKVDIEDEVPETPAEVKEAETENKPLKRKCSTTPDPPPKVLNKKFAAASKKKAISRLSQNLKTNLQNKRGSTKSSKLVSSSLKKSQSVAAPSPQKSRSQMPARLTRAQTQAPSNGFIHPVKIQSETLPQARNHDSLFQTVTEKIKTKLKCRPINDSDKILRTGTMYHVTQDIQPQYVLLSPKKCNSRVEIPSFRINPVANCYTLEGTENLEDEIFLKRHQKPETDEKRRKRWDMQRIREQKLYEKLKEGRCGSKYSSSNFVKEQIETFQPEPEDATHIEITNKIPVNAFGYPIPSLSPGEFSLPWYKVSTQSPSTSSSAKKSKLKLKRR